VAAGSTSVSPTGDAYVDGILSGIKWNTTVLTYSFPTDASFYGSFYGANETATFSAFNAMQQTAARTTLSMYASVSNLKFTEVTETATTHADIRYAESASPSTAWAYYPSSSALGGDAWFNTTRYDYPTPGTYAWLTIMHETGHSLGLKHPHEATA
jgi:serralysin